MASFFVIKNQKKEKQRYEKKKIGEHQVKPSKAYLSSKKLISLLLVMALLACSIPITVFAKTLVTFRIGGFFALEFL